MKKINRLSALLSVVLFLAIGQNSFSQEKNFKINGILEDFSPVPQTIYLSYNDIYGKKPDSAIVVNGKYAFSGKVGFSAPAILSLVKNTVPVPGSNTLQVILGNGDIDVKSTGDFLHSQVSGNGSLAHRDLGEATAFARNESADLQRIMASPGYAQNDSLQAVVKKRTSVIFPTALINTIAYARKNPASPISPFLIYTLISSGMVTPTMTDTLMNIFPDELKTSDLGIGIERILKKRKDAADEYVAKLKALDEMIPLGSNAKDFSMENVSGKMVSLSSFKGRYVLIDFWASWCKPCREENPNLVKAYAAFHKKGFDILGVSLDKIQQKTAWLEAIKQDHLNWEQVSDLKGFENAAAKLYNVTSIPQNFLIDPQGKIIAKNLRGDALDKKLAEIFIK